MNLLIRRETFVWRKTIVSHRIHNAKKNGRRENETLHREKGKKAAVRVEKSRNARARREREREREREKAGS